MRNDESLNRIKKKLEIAERKVQILEDMIENRTRELHTKSEQNEELELFAFITSHDLQEPLRTIIGFADLLKEEFKEKLDENGNEYIHYISDSAKRMSQQLKDLMVYSRVGRRKPLNVVNCYQLINEVIQSLSKLIAENKAQIYFDQMPTVNAYEIELRQLFQNLITNAIKFRRKDCLPKIHISAEYDGVRWRFAIKDNGIGIESIYLEKIFVVFQRLHTREEYEGTGMGLAICKKIVELHGGDIWVESQPGIGSTFYFTI